ncbi:MAG: hypothetical protein ACLGI3_20840 [Actinomycetes bacterium]
MVGYSPQPYRSRTAARRRLEFLVIVPAVVLLLCGVVVLVGGSAELLDTVRQRRLPVPVPAAGTDAPEPTVEDVGRWPLPAWFGAAAFPVLGAASVAGREPGIPDLTVAALLLGFAGERAFYLVRRRTSGSRRAVGAELLALSVGAIGLLVGATL